MRKFLGLIAFFGLMSAGCNSEDDSAVIDDSFIQTASLQGEWLLSNVNGTLMGINEDISRGEVIWTFNDTDKTIKVVNNISKTTVPWLLESGTYSYTHETFDDHETLTIDDISYGTVSFPEGQLSLDQRAVDGVQMIFER